MNDEIIGYLRERPDGTASLEIAERFLKFKSPDPRLAHIAVKAVLGKDKRLACDDAGLWRVTAAPAGATALGRMPWVAVSLVNHGVSLIHAGVWSVFPEPALLASEWLADPGALAPEDRETLDIPADAAADPLRREEALAGIAGLIRQAVPFYLSGQHQALLSQHCLAAGEVLGDEGFYAGQLCAACGIQRPWPLTPDSLYRTVMAGNPVPVPPARIGRQMAECLQELIGRLSQEGIETREQLEQRQSDEVAAFDFTGKAFTFEDLNNLPAAPGVYRFNNRAGETIYVGKATNLRRRIMPYFGNSEESPAKLERLRAESQALTTYACGSELESLIYEYRLIRKYKPALNTQIDINERKGAFTPIQDCIVLLPHTEPQTGMSVWFRHGQKIMLRPFYVDFREADALAVELQEFFFSEKLAPSATDFPEQEIAHRWVRRRQDSLLLVPVYRLATGDEVLQSMRSYWQDAR